MSSIVIIKFIDMAFKLNMLQKISQGYSIGEIMPVNIKMTLLFRYMNVLIYPLSFAFATKLFF